MLPLTIEITDANGIQWRPPFRGLKYAKTFYGGEDLWLAFILDRDTSQDYPDVGYGYDVVLRNGLEPLFRGEIRQIETDLETVTVKVLGTWVHLNDYGYGGQGMLWCDSRYGRFLPVQVENLPGHVPERFRMDTQNRLFIAPVKGERIGQPNHHSGALYYHCQYDDVQRVSWDYEMTQPDNWEGKLVSCTDAWTVERNEWVSGLAGSGTKDVGLFITRPIIFFCYRYVAGIAQYNGETGETAYLKITNLRIWGQDGVLRVGPPHSRSTTETPSIIHIGEDIIPGGEHGPR